MTIKLHSAWDIWTDVPDDDIEHLADRAVWLHKDKVKGVIENNIHPMMPKKLAKILKELNIE